MKYYLKNDIFELEKLVLKKNDEIANIENSLFEFQNDHICECECDCYSSTIDYSLLKENQF